MELCCDRLKSPRQWGVQGGLCLTMLRHPAGHVWGAGLYCGPFISSLIETAGHYHLLTSQSQSNGHQLWYLHISCERFLLVLCLLFAKDQTPCSIRGELLWSSLPPSLFSPKLVVHAAVHCKVISNILQNIKISLSGFLHFWFISSFIFIFVILDHFL